MTKVAQLGRWPLALLAVFSAGLPCLLAAACTGQAGSGQTGAAGRQAVASKKLAETASARPSASRSTRRSSPFALRLMTQAAQAAVLSSYQGEEITNRFDAAGSTSLVSDIWHTSGGQTVTQLLAADAAQSAQPSASKDQDRRSPEGVLGVTSTLVKLLAQNYVVTYAGTATAINRNANVIEAWRVDDSLAARFWLDARTRLPLERVVFGPAMQLISQGYFVSLPVGPAPHARTAPVNWAHTLATAELIGLSRGGWVVPRALPGGLSLFAGGESATTTGPVLDLAYSDGLYVVSVFEQHGKLAPRLAGWEKTKVNGVVVYATVSGQRSFTWAGKGTVYTMIADAPAQVVTQAVVTLPHDRPPGFWRRVTHGLARLADLVNPFG